MAWDREQGGGQDGIAGERETEGQDRTEWLGMWNRGHEGMGQGTGGQNGIAWDGKRADRSGWLGKGNWRDRTGWQGTRSRRTGGMAGNREQRDRTGWQGIGGTGRNGRGQGTGGQDGI